MKEQQQFPQTLQQAIEYFADEQHAIDAVARMRWPNGEPVCPACETKNNHWLKNQRRWQCRECTKQFSVKLGTIFEDSAIPLSKWMLAMWMMANCRNGASSYEIARAIGITQKSAWFMLHRIRYAMRTKSIIKLGGSGGPVEADETFVGGNPQRMHASRRARIKAIAANTYGVRDRNAGKAIVMGMLDRDLRQVRAMVVPDVKRASLQEHILNHIQGGAKVMTDDLPTYRYILAEKFAHQIVNHAKEYVNGQVHTQGIENFWSLLKRGLRGTYVAVEPFHLDRYVDEQVFRYNHRMDANKNKLTDAQRFEALLGQVSGKRLTFAEVTGKVVETNA